MPFLYILQDRGYRGTPEERIYRYLLKHIDLRYLQQSGPSCIFFICLVTGPGAYLLVMLASWARPEWAWLLFLSSLVFGLDLSGPGLLLLLFFHKWSRFSFLVLLGMGGQMSVGPANAKKRLVVTFTNPNFKNLLPNPNFFCCACECCYVF